MTNNQQQTIILEGLDRLNQSIEVESFLSSIVNLLTVGEFGELINRKSQVSDGVVVEQFTSFRRRIVFFLVIMINHVRLVVIESSLEVDL